MRKVNYKKYIPLEHDGNVELGYTRRSGTGCWQEDFVNVGMFHKWGQSFEEFESGPANYTVAIVETEDGNIEEVIPVNIKFCDTMKEFNDSKEEFKKSLQEASESLKSTDGGIEKELLSALKMLVEETEDFRPLNIDNLKHLEIAREKANKLINECKF